MEHFVFYKTELAYLILVFDCACNILRIQKISFISLYFENNILETHFRLPLVILKVNHSIEFRDNKKRTSTTCMYLYISFINTLFYIDLNIRGSLIKHVFST